MKRYAETRGYRAEGFRNLSLDALVAMKPVIVPIEEYGNAHFVVFGNRRIRVERFREVWKDGIGFTITRPAS